MKILIVHDNRDLGQLRRTSFNHAFFLPKYAPEHSYTIHCYGDPVTESLRTGRFDAILLDTTFLCWRWAYPRETFYALLENYSFIAESDAVKLAFPQDEYDHSELLDEWLSRWRVDVIYSVCYAHRALFYPKAAATAEIRAGLTGYVDDADIEFARKIARPFAERTVDVGYRAKFLPPQFGRFGQMKAEIGFRFKERFGAMPVKLDISLRPEDTIAGDDWLSFLGNSRFTLGSESGSSLLDPRGEIQTRIREFVAHRPEARFDEVEAACFPGEDGRNVFSAISPRIFETTLARSCNILVPGEYLGVLKPDEHYIPLTPDLSNAEEVYAKMQDERRVRDRIEAAYSALIETPRFRYRTFAQDVLKAIECHALKKGFHPVAPSLVALRRFAHRGGMRDPLKRHAQVVQMLRKQECAIQKQVMQQGQGARPHRAGFGRTICLLSLSPIADDPRVRRQGDAFHRAGWNVIAVGLPGATSSPPVWPILLPVEPKSTPQSVAQSPEQIATGSRDASAGRLRRSLLAPIRRKGIVRRLLRSILEPVRYNGRPVALELVVALVNWILRTIARVRWRSVWLAVRMRNRAKLLGVRIAPALARGLFDATYPTVYRLAEAANEVKADIWLANDWLMLPVATQLAREHGGAYGYDTHELATDEYAERREWRLWQRPLVRAIESRAIRDAVVVSAVSSGIAIRLQRLYRLRRAPLVIRNVPRYERGAFRPTGARIRVLYHGLVVAGRGIEAMIESVSAWRPEAELTLRGPGTPDYLRELEAQICRFGVEGRVVLAPPVPMTALVFEAAAFDVGIFALPGHSRHNKFALPNKVFEYVMAGLALCVSDLPEMARLIRDYDLGVLIPRLDPASIAAAVNSLDPARIDRYKRNALLAAEELCWEKEAERLVGSYDAVVQRVPG